MPPLVLSSVVPLAMEQASPDVQELAAPALAYVNPALPLAFQAVAPVQQSVMVLAAEVLEREVGGSDSEYQQSLIGSYSGRQ